MVTDDMVRIVNMPEMRTLSKYVIVRETPEDEMH